LIKNAGSIAYKKIIKEYKGTGQPVEHVKSLAISASDAAKTAEKDRLDSLKKKPALDAD
jgi:hypothetical protein